MLQTGACFRSLVQAVPDLTATDADVLQFPVTELVQGNEFRLTRVTRDRSRHPAINEAT
jgi:hypothetical protein